MIELNCSLRGVAQPTRHNTSPVLAKRLIQLAYGESADWANASSPPIAAMSDAGSLPPMMSEADRLWCEACNLDDQGRLEEAILMYQRAVAAGSTDAMVNLAMIYEHRTSPPKSQDAIVLNERAAARGNRLAAWNLHRTYEMEGREAESHRWLKVAAELGDEEAVALLSEGR